MHHDVYLPLFIKGRLAIQLGIYCLFKNKVQRDPEPIMHLGWASVGTLAYLYTGCPWELVTFPVLQSKMEYSRQHLNDELMLDGKAL